MDNELTLSDVSRGLDLWYDIQAVRTRYLGPDHQDPRQLMSFHFSGWYYSLMAVTINIFVTIGYIHSHQLWPEFTNSLGIDSGPPDGNTNAFMFFVITNAFVAFFFAAINSSTAVARIEAEDAYRDYLKAEKHLVTKEEYKPPRYPAGRRNRSLLVVTMDPRGKDTYDLIDEVNLSHNLNLDTRKFILAPIDTDQIFLGTALCVPIEVKEQYQYDIAPFTVAIRIPSPEVEELSPLAVERSRSRYIAMLTGGSFREHSLPNSSGFNPHIVTPSQVAIPGKTRMSVEYVDYPMGTLDNSRAEITCVRKELLC